MESLVSFISALIMIIMLLLSVAFFTLMERKILGYMQIRKGPNKVGISGILQPFSDAIKLFTKELIIPINSNYLIYYFCPVVNLLISLFIWMVMPYFEIMYMHMFSFLFLVSLMSLGVYLLMISGWSSNSNYSLLGMMRSISQTISYEVSMLLLLLSSVMLVMDLNMFKYNLYQNYVWFLFIMFPLSMCVFSSLLAETNRTPYDFAEGESELVSGFNIEYAGGGFALIFLSEYMMIMFMSLLFSIIFLGANYGSVFLFIKLVVLSYTFVWVRAVLPRYRYDKLMYLTWKVYLPFSLFSLMFFLGFKLFLWNFFSKN
uniref:NADH-ubiquinone oxidoreductase chain 1 n=1 Tax=Stenopsyche angustata TaxID=1560148 RepID=A0A7L8XGD1_9NEOP|nr:NADH dehydrogenase subunit 1 [Stenopsyche angustata]QOH91251.1 NADH dehydrogenase subunit 1 [Stenopsyche angustata]